MKEEEEEENLQEVKLKEQDDEKIRNADNIELQADISGNYNNIKFAPKIPIEKEITYRL